MTALADKFVWILVDPSRSEKNKEIMGDYEFRLEDEMGELLSLPTAVFLDVSGKIVKAAMGKVKAEDFVAIMKGVLGE
ncbi:MAG: hypothetical protein ACYTHM_02195 [Planctomycetota bacterium]